MRLYLLGILAVIGVFISCGDDGEDELPGASINAPKVVPPVERNTPTGITSTSLSAPDTSTAEGRLANNIKSYLKPTQSDAMGALDRLKSIDERMAELDLRAQDRQKVCLQADAKAYTLSGTLPGSDTMSLQLQCQENLDQGDGGAETSQLAFGLNTTDFYLFERTGLHNNAVLARATLDETTTEFWQVGTGNSENFIHLIATDGVGMEFTAAGTSTATLDCGVHMKSNSKYIYAEGYDGTSTCTTTLVTICLDATTLETSDVANCTAAKLNVFTLDTITVAKVNATDDGAKKIVKTPIVGHIDFTESVEVEDPNSGDE